MPFNDADSFEKPERLGDEQSGDQSSLAGDIWSDMENSARNLLSVLGLQRTEEGTLDLSCDDIYAGNCIKYDGPSPIDFGGKPLFDGDWQRYIGGPLKYDGPSPIDFGGKPLFDGDWQRYVGGPLKYDGPSPIDFGGKPLVDEDRRRYIGGPLKWDGPPLFGANDSDMKFDPESLYM